MLVRTALILFGFTVAACSSASNRSDPVASQVESRSSRVNSNVQSAPSDAIALTEDLRQPDVGERQASIGDTLLITDANHADDLTLSKKIDIDGTVLLPELGSLCVTGYSSTELCTLLRERWAPFIANLDLQVEIVATGEGPTDLNAAAIPPRPLLQRILGRLRAWWYDWILHPPILIAGASAH